MRRPSLAVALLGLVSCVATLGQEDGFRERVQAGCLSASSCRSLLDEAQARVQRCRPNTMGFVRCDEATADARVARGYVREFERGETLQRARARARRLPPMRGRPTSSRSPIAITPST